MLRQGFSLSKQCARPAPSGDSARFGAFGAGHEALLHREQLEPSAREAERTDQPNAIARTCTVAPERTAGAPKHAGRYRKLASPRHVTAGDRASVLPSSGRLTVGELIELKAGKSLWKPERR